MQPQSNILVCLHGWGGSKESFTELREALKDTAIKILTPDLPGFGAEIEPKEPWTVDDYADWVDQWIQKELKTHTSYLIPILLLGHSHGGRIALKLAYRQSQHSYLIPHTFSIDRLFLCAPAGIRHVRHIKRILGLTLAKTGKLFLSVPCLKSLTPFAQKLLYKLVRVHDYEKASPVMQGTMLRVTREDLRPILKSITLPVDLFWGTDDGMTPYSDALLMKNELPHAILHTYPGVHHGVHRDRAREIAAVIRARIGA